MSVSSFSKQVVFDLKKRSVMISLLIFFLVINNNVLSFTNKNRQYYRTQNYIPYKGKEENGDLQR